jgi:hypothetical protein
MWALSLMKYNMGGADGSSGQIQRQAIEFDTRSITINVLQITIIGK